MQTLSPSGQAANGPQVAVDTDGDAVFTWYRFDGAHQRVQGRARASNGTLSAAQTLSAAGQSATIPQVAVDADGDAVFTWQRSDGTNSRVQARARTAGGTLSTAQTLSTAGEDWRSPRSRSTPTATRSSPGSAWAGQAINGRYPGRGRPPAP